MYFLLDVFFNANPFTQILSKNREKLAQAYDFALEKIGMDLHSFSIWSDYVQFLRGVEAAGSFAENQKITAVRRVYQKAVLTPIIGIEILWKEYIQFEQNINPIISEKMSLERSRDYMNARRVAKELEAVTKGLNRNLPAIPPTLTKEEMKQVELWKKYIAFEKSNPLRSEDTALVTRRVMFATEQCLLVLNHHPAVWHQAAQYLDQSSKLLTEKGVRILVNLLHSKLDDTITAPTLITLNALQFWIAYSVIRIKIGNAFALLMNQIKVEKTTRLCRIIYFIHMKWILIAKSFQFIKEK